MNIALIPAAGTGSRIGGPRAKQFPELNGTPILIHTLRRFEECECIDQIIVVLPASELLGFLDLADKYHLKKITKAVAGGAERQKSVFNGIHAINNSNAKIVVVHDGVRPFVTEQIIHDVIQAAQKYGAAIAGLPAVDTVKQVDRTADGALITATLPRERVVMAQTPQGFRYDVLKKAFDEATADGFTGTDEASLVERSGHEVAVVMGSPSNIKITTPADMELAEFYLKSAS